MIKVTDDARFWNRAARKYANGPIADQTGYDRTLEGARHYLQTDHVVFEFGCGTGTTALRLAPFVRSIVASDISHEMIAIARERAEEGDCANAIFEVATPEETRWSDETFDVALGFNILHLVAAREAALKCVHRLLKPGGVFISKTPCMRETNWLMRIAVAAMRLIGKAPFVAFLSYDELEQEIEAAGFDIVERDRHGSRGKDVRLFLVARKRLVLG